MLRSLQLAALVVVAPCLGGCLAHMSAASQEKFDTCWPRFERRECLGSAGDEELEACRAELNAEYTSFERQSDRDRWLVDHGCPESRVYPELE